MLLNKIFIVFFLYITILGFPIKLFANQLEIDISNNLVSITSSFIGEKILLFGTYNHQGDIAIIVEGPKEKLSVRKKNKIAGVWINKNKVIFKDVLAYYAIITSAPINNIGTVDLRKKYLIGTKTLPIKIYNNNNKINNDEIEKFKKALIRNKIEESLYYESQNSITFNKNLFRTTINLPSNAPEGKYKIKTYIVSKNEIIDFKEKELFLEKEGIEKTIYKFAKEKPALYGLTAILLAIFSGWLAAAVFRRS